MNKKAFTIIEVLISMGILATLVGSVTPIMVTKLNVDYAKKTAREMMSVEQAAKNYYKDNYSWPASIQELKDGGYVNASWNELDPWGQPFQVSSTAERFTVSARGVPEKYQGAALMILPQSRRAGGSIITSTVSPPGEALASREMLHKSSNDDEYRTMKDTLYVPRVESNDPSKPYYYDYNTGLAYVEDLYVESLGKNISEFKPTIHKIKRVVEYKDVYDRPYGTPEPRQPGQVWNQWDCKHTVKTWYKSGGWSGGWYHGSDEGWQWDGGREEGYGDRGAWHTITHHVPSGWHFSHAVPLGWPQARTFRDSGNGSSCDYQANDFDGNKTYDDVGMRLYGWRIQ